MYKKIGKRFVSPFREFISDSRAVGITLIFCTLVSLIVSNGDSGTAYIHFWEQARVLPFSNLHLPHSFLHFINDALMAVFFFLAGLEIKRELIAGELSSFKKSALPIIAAIGGMVIPALFYMLWCGGTPYSRGWGIPMATDIAFSLGVLSLLGRKAPFSFRVFLTALAIIDDLGGIVLIGLFYAGELNGIYLGLAAAVFAVLLLLNIFKVSSLYLYFLLGIGLWYFVFNSGIHATVAGVLLALTIPLKKSARLEQALHHPVSFIILPLFALANTAILLPGDIAPLLSSPLYMGVFIGLVVGKPLGIFLCSYAAVKLRLAEMPERMTYKDLLGIGMIAGIGFTMSVFIATLAFSDVQMQLTAKLAILMASAMAGILGYLYLLFLRKKERAHS